MEKRSFCLTRISEEEGLVLKSLLNLSEEGVKQKLLVDESAWGKELPIEEAIKIGVKICKQVSDMYNMDLIEWEK